MLNFYIFVNEELNMKKGYACAQVSHITQIITENIVRNSYESFSIAQDYIMYMKWKNKNTSGTTIVLKANFIQLNELINQGGMPFYDNNILTCVGFCPGKISDDDVTKYKLF